MSEYDDLLAAEITAGEGAPEGLPPDIVYRNGQYYRRDNLRVPISGYTPPQPQSYDAALTAAIGAGGRDHRIASPEGAAADATHDANYALASMLGFPLEVIGEAMDRASDILFATTGSRAMERQSSRPGDAIAAVQEAFRGMGVTLDAAQRRTLAGEIGSSTMSAMLAAVGLRVGGPAMARRPAGAPLVGPVVGEGAFRGLARDIGEMAVNRPVTTAVATVAATPGQVVGGRTLGGAAESGAEALGAEPGSFPHRLASVTGETVGNLAGGVVSAVPAVGVASRLPSPSSVVQNVVPRAQNAVTGAIDRATGRPASVPRPVPPVDTMIPRHEQPPRLPLQNEGIVSAEADPSRVTGFAQTHIQDLTQRIEDAVMTTIGRVNPARYTAADTARGLHRDIVAIEDGAQAVARRMWGTIPEGMPVTGSFTRTAIEAAESRFRRTDQGAFGDARLWNDLRNLVIETDAQGNVTTATPTWRQLQDVRSRLLADVRSERGSTVRGQAPNDNLIQLYRDVASAIVDDVGVAAGSQPGNIALRYAQARAFTRAVSELFDRGPLAELLTATSRGERRMPPQETLRNLLTNVSGQTGERGSEVLAGSGQQLARQTGLRTGERAGIFTRSDVASNSFSNAIEAEYAQLAQQAAQEAAVRGATRSGQVTAAGRTLQSTVAENLQALRPYVNLSSRMSGAGQRIGQLFRARTTAEESALNRFFAEGNGTAEAGVARIMSSANPAREIRAIMQGITANRRGPGVAPGRARAALVGDAEAVAGLQRAVVERFLNSGGKSFIAAASRANSPRWEAAFRELFRGDPSKHDRLQKILQTGAAIERGDTNASRKWSSRAVTFLAHVTGLHLGRVIAQGLGLGAYGSLSLPARASGYMRRWALELFSEIAPERAMAWAVVDPAVERMFLSRVPSNIREGQAFHTHQTRLLSRLNTARDLAVRDFLNGGRVEAAERRNREIERRRPLRGRP